LAGWEGSKWVFVRLGAAARTECAPYHRAVIPISPFQFVYSRPFVVQPFS